MLRKKVSQPESKTSTEPYDLYLSTKTTLESPPTNQLQEKTTATTPRSKTIWLAPLSLCAAVVILGTFVISFTSFLHQRSTVLITEPALHADSSDSLSSKAGRDSQVPINPYQGNGASPNTGALPEGVLPGSLPIQGRLPGVTAYSSPKDLRPITCASSQDFLEQTHLTVQKNPLMRQNVLKICTYEYKPSFMISIAGFNKEREKKHTYDQYGSISFGTPKLAIRYWSTHGYTVNQLTATFTDPSLPKNFTAIDQEIEGKNHEIIVLSILSLSALTGEGTEKISTTSVKEQLSRAIMEKFLDTQSSSQSYQR